MIEDQVVVDHTGERWENREIIGPGEIMTYVRRGRNGKEIKAQEQLWRWKCVVCGAEGECRYYLTREKHKCGVIAKPRNTIQSTFSLSKAQKDEPYVCTKQCRGCGHYREISGILQGNCCHYSIDMRKLRPKVDLRTEPCPVRNEKFKAPKARPIPVKKGTELLRRIAENEMSVKRSVIR